MNRQRIILGTALVIATLIAAQVLAVPRMRREVPDDPVAVHPSHLGVVVTGGQVALADPRGRSDRQRKDSECRIPNCSRIEGSTKGVHPPEDPLTPRVQLDLRDPIRGTYLLEVRAERPLLSVLAVGELPGAACSSGDHLSARLGRTYRWRVWWGADQDTGKCQLRLERVGGRKVR
jgi:hypothetical protein